MTFDRETGLEELQRQEFRKFQHLPDVIQQGLGGGGASSSALPADVAIGTGGGGAARIPTIFVAASDATPDEKAAAKYQATGSLDHSTIQEAADEIHASDTNRGGRILLSSGTFTVNTDQMSLGEDIWLSGLSKLDTVIKTADVTGTVLTMGNDCTVSDLVISGVNAFGPDALIEFQDGCWANRLYLERAAAGIQLGNANVITECQSLFLPIFADGAWGGTFGYQDILIANNMEIGLIRSDSSGSNITNWVIANNLLFDQIEIKKCDGFSIVGNAWQPPGGNNNALIEITNASDGIVSGNNTYDGAGYDAMAVTSSTSILVAGNTWNQMTKGILLTTSTRCIVSGNILGDGAGANAYHGQHGVEVNGSSDCIISDNLVFEPGQDLDNTYDGILVTGDSNNNDIHGNKIVSQVTTSPRYGINIATSTADDNRIGDNDYGVLTDYGTFPLNDLGTGTKFPTARTADMSQAGTLSTGAGVARYPIHEPSIMLDGFPTVGTAPSGGPVTVDLNKNGTTMYATATNPSVASGANMGTAAKADQTTFVAGDEIRLDLDAVNGAADLTCVVRFLVA